MPRPKVRTDHVWGWQVVPLRLSQATVSRLLTIARLDAGGRLATGLIAVTETALGQYHDRVRAHDEAPRPAARLSSLTHLHGAADQLIAAIDGIDPETSGHLVFAGHSIGELQHQLRSLRDQIERLQQSPSLHRESRGAAPRVALRMTLDDIASAYIRAVRAFWGDDEDEGSPVVTAESLARYLRTACAAAKIPDVPEAPAKLLALLPDHLKVHVAFL